MNLTEIDRALRKLRLSGMAEHLELRILEAQTSRLAPLDFLGTLVSDELLRRSDRLIERRIKRARFRDQGKSLDNFDFDFDFNKKMDRALIFELATGRFLSRAEDALFLGPPGTGKSHLAQALGLAVILQGSEVAYREAHVLLEELADATLDGMRKEYLAPMQKVPLLIIDDFGLRRLPVTAAEDLLEVIMRRFERASTLVRPHEGRHVPAAGRGQAHGGARRPRPVQGPPGPCQLTRPSVAPQPVSSTRSAGRMSGGRNWPDLGCPPRPDLPGLTSPARCAGVRSSRGRPVRSSWARLRGSRRPGRPQLSDSLPHVQPRDQPP